MAAPYAAKLRQRTLPFLASIITQPQTKRPGLTPTERYKLFYHDNLKKDEERYTEYLEKKKTAAKKAYINGKINDTKEEQQRKREANRLRVQKHRQKKKDAGGEIKKVTKSSKPTTRVKKEKKTILLPQDAEKKKAILLQRDAERKKAERAKWSMQKRKAEAQKAKERREMKKRQGTHGNHVGKEDDGIKNTDLNSGIGITSVARKKALARARAALPKDEKEALETVEDLYHIFYKSKEGNANVDTGTRNCKRKGTVPRKVCSSKQ